MHNLAIFCNLCSISNLTNLEMLDLSNNKGMWRFPQEICEMKSLKLLNLARNGFAEIPR